MRHYAGELERIANDILNQNVEAKGDENKPNYTKRDFMNCLIIFQTALMDKMWDNMDFDNMPTKERLDMAESCGNALRQLIFTYTGLDVAKVEEFI